MADKSTAAPLCKICDPPRKHWKGEPHKFSGSKAAELSSGSDIAHDDTGDEVCSSETVAESAKPDAASSNLADSTKFDRAAYHRNYMREYMRKKRAAKKGKS